MHLPTFIWNRVDLPGDSSIHLGILSIVHWPWVAEGYYSHPVLCNDKPSIFSVDSNRESWRHQRQICLEMFRLLEKNSAVPKILEAQRSKFSELAHSNWERQCLSGNCEKDVSQTRPGAHLIFKRCRGTFHLNTFFMFVEEGSLLVPWSHWHMVSIFITGGRYQELQAARRKVIKVYNFDQVS